MCDYLVAHLSPPELRSWRHAYTALHEMLGAVWFGRTTNETGKLEQDAWENFSPVAFVESPARAFTLLPPNFDHGLFLPHYVGFVRFVGEQRSLPAIVVERICSELVIATGGAVAVA